MNLAISWARRHYTKNKVFDFKDFFSKRDQWSYLLKKPLTENLIFGEVRNANSMLSIILA